MRTEQILSWHKKRKLARQEKQKKKNPVLDWIEAFLWAAGVVLLINQYFLQAYQIPSKSMTDTLLVSDRIFVNKLIYGPELIPGMLKLPGISEPDRGDVIIFENPSYISKGSAFDVLQRVLYMLTLSLVDIDRDEYGNPRPHFLIKRAIGVERDRIRLRSGDIQIMPEGEGEWIPEEQFFPLAGLEYTVRRILQPEDYQFIRAAGIADAYRYLGLKVPERYQAAQEGVQSLQYPDMLAENLSRMKILHAAAPYDERVRSLWMRENLGWYIPEDSIFPLGDNRDNSRDGRFFGPVHLDNVLGNAMIKYWPPGRFGPVR